MEKRMNLWQICTILLGALLVASIFTNGFSGGGVTVKGKISAQEAGEQAVAFLNANLLQAGQTARLMSVQDAGDLYNAKLDIAGRGYDSFITKDGRLLFPTGIALSDTGEPSPSQPTQPSQPTPTEKFEVSADDDPVKGNKNAPVTIIEFSDFQCPFCGRFWSDTLPQIQKEYIDTGKVKFVYRDFPINSIHPNAQPAAEAAECANEQGKFWEFHDKIFQNQQQLGVENYKKWAAELGLNAEKFNDCVDSKKYAEEVMKDFQEGQNAGVSGTPAFFVNGKLLSGAQPFAAFKAAIDAESIDVELK